MHKQPRLLIFPAIVAALALGPVVAHADFTAPQAVNFGPAGLAFQANPTFQKFDPSLGTLTAVSLTIGGTLNGDLIGVYGGSGPSTVTEEVFAKVSVAGPSGLDIEVPLHLQHSDLLTGGGSFESKGSTTQLASPTPAQLADLSPYVGPGTFNLGIDFHPDPQTINNVPVASYFYFSNGNGSGSIDVTGIAGVILQYQYTPAVPEPAGIVLLISGGGTLLLARRLRRRTPGARTAGREDDPTA